MVAVQFCMSTRLNAEHLLCTSSTVFGCSRLCRIVKWGCELEQCDLCGMEMGLLPGRSPASWPAAAARSRDRKLCDVTDFALRMALKRQFFQPDSYQVAIFSSSSIESLPFLCRSLACSPHSHICLGVFLCMLWNLVLWFPFNSLRNPPRPRTPYSYIGAPLTPLFPQTHTHAYNVPYFSSTLPVRAYLALLLPSLRGALYQFDVTRFAVFVTILQCCLHSLAGPVCALPWWN